MCHVKYKKLLAYDYNTMQQIFFFFQTVDVNPLLMTLFAKALCDFLNYLLISVLLISWGSLKPLPIHSTCHFLSTCTRYFYDYMAFLRKGFLMVTTVKPAFVVCVVIVDCSLQPVSHGYPLIKVIGHHIRHPNYKHY